MTKFQKKIMKMFPNESWSRITIDENDTEAWYFYFGDGLKTGFQVIDNDTIEMFDDLTKPYIKEKVVSLEFMIKKMKLQNFK